MKLFTNDRLEIDLQHDLRLWSGRIAGLFNVDWWITDQVVSLSFSILCFTLHIEYWNFETETPNEETKAAFAEPEADLPSFSSVEELFKDLESDDEEIPVSISKNHAGDCSIYASVDNVDVPEAGICTCGYGRQCLRNGDWTQMYSKELLEKRASERLR